jgi:MFS family permease
LASPTRSVLLTPSVRLQGVAGLIAQLTQGAAPIGIVLIVRQHSGSVALGGAVAGALAIAVAVARPVQGRLIDRRGMVGVMVVCGLVHPAAVSAIVGLAVVHAPAVVLVALGALAGLALPPVSTAMRVAWGEAVDQEDRTAAYSMVYLTQELALLIGPLIFAAMIAATSPPLGLVTVTVLSGAGALVFAASVRDIAPPGIAAPTRGGNVLGSSRMRALLAIAVLLGGIVGALDVGIPTLATARHTPVVAGILVALLSIGGILGAIVYGARRWAAEPSARLWPLSAVMTIAGAAMVAAPSVAAVGALLLIVGLALNPALTTLSLLVDRVSANRTAAEAFGWLSTGLSAGTGAASALAGALIRHGHSARPAFIVAAAAAAAATALALTVRQS